MEVKHVMSNGDVLDSLEGVVVPVCAETQIYYNIMAKRLKRIMKQKERARKEVEKSE